MSESLVIVWHLLLALGVIYFCGYGITRLCGKGQSMMPVVGYAASQLMFFPFYFIFVDANMAVVAVLMVAALLNVVSLWLTVTAPAESQAVRRNFLLLAAAGIFVLLVAAWPYFMAGHGNYWHSGNEDFFDAINGRDAYVHQDVALQEYWEEAYKHNRWDSKELEIAVANPVTVEDAAGHLVDIYAADLGRLQYSSTAFWSVVLNAKLGLDAWLIQALFNLLLMGHGLALLLKRALPIGQVMAVLVATAAVANNFYLTTYLNGHQGSLMFAAVLPYGLLLAMDILEREREKRARSVVILMVLLLFSVGTYPYPLPFILLAIFAYWILQRFSNEFLRRRYLVGLLLFLLVAFYVGSWFLFEPVRERALGQFRSWGTLLNFIGFFQFWGLWPSFLAAPVSVGFMHQIINNSGLILASYLTGIGLCGLAVYGLYRAARMKYFLFVAFAVMWLALFPFMRFIVYDSYYLYKFLYLNNFFVVALMIFGYLQIRIGGFFKMLKITAGGVVGVWVVLNLTNNIWATRALSELPYNAQVAEYRALIPVFQGKNMDIYSDLPKRGTNGKQLGDHESVIRNYLWGAGLKYKRDLSKAKYLLRMNGMEDIVEYTQEKVLWKSSLFRLIEAPSFNLLTVGSPIGPEYGHTSRPERNSSFRWVSGGKKNGFFEVDILRPDENTRFLHFCAETGPSVDYKPILLHSRDGMGNDLGERMIGNFGCYWVDLAGRQSPFRFFSDVEGHSFSPLEARRLNFKVMNVGVSNSKYDLATLRYLNEYDDITPKATALALRSLTHSKNGTVYLANGWYGLERQGNDSFRWARSGAQLIVENCPGVISLDIEPGPSLGRMPMNFLVRSSTGRIVAEFQVAERSLIKFPIDLSATDEHTIELISESKELAIPGDARTLDFRVFSVTWNKKLGMSDIAQ